ncbi:MAG TPA: peptide-methionine (R)-S-oxide reductase MsrB [Candidatus Acidoferrum sp.]|nr:peptide-methionine (R)-S-oxide reductase MsrB [Candidatus Acidoferrum sp.]
MFEANLEEERSGKSWGRRPFLFASVAALAGALAWRYKGPEATHAEALPAGPPKLVTIVEFDNDGERKDTLTFPVIRKTDAEWRNQLSADSFEITRLAGTERAFSGDLLEVHDKGVFRCICCNLALFSSATKFDSGTGWPSFWAPIAKENIVESLDTSFGMERTAVSCKRCEAHLGHVFDDGPRPTGLRYCINSLAMRFGKA